MERTESFTTWLRVVIAAALAITLGTFIGGGTPAGVAQAAIGLTTFEIDRNSPVNTAGNVDWENAAAPNIYGYENRTDPCAGGGSEASAAVGKLDPGG
ncbi:MAG: hypothetical protein R2697_18580 [Ilumatobacteraceae bacterium]